MRDMLKMFGLLGAGIAICMAMDAPVWAQDQAVTLTDDASIDKVIAAMTLEEKTKLIAGVGMANPELRINGAAGGTYPIPRLGIPQVVVTDRQGTVVIDSARIGSAAALQQFAALLKKG